MVLKNNQNFISILLQLYVHAQSTSIIQNWVVKILIHLVQFNSVVKSIINQISFLPWIRQIT
eukprot:UN12382